MQQCLRNPALGPRRAIQSGQLPLLQQCLHDSGDHDLAHRSADRASTSARDTVDKLTILFKKQYGYVFVRFPCKLRS